MPRQPILRFRFFRSFLLIGFLVNAGAVFANRPFVSYIAAFSTLAFVAFCFRCARCGKSPYTLIRKYARIGSPVPERVCSRCGFNFLTEAESLAPSNDRWSGP